MNPSAEQIPRISLIIPIYKVAKEIGDCLRSVFAQELPLELILVDDKGGDESMDIVHQMLKLCPEMMHPRIIDQGRNQGVSAARNAGLEAASGEYVFFLDGDDSLLPDALPCLLALADEQDAEVAMGQVRTQSGRRDIQWIRTAADLCLSGDECLDAFFDEKWPQTAWNKLMKRDFLLRHNLRFPVGLRMHEDALWCIALALTKPRLVSSSNDTYLYYDNREGAVTTLVGKEKSLELLEQKMSVLRRYEKLAREHKLYTRPSFGHFYFIFALSIIRAWLQAQELSSWQQHRFLAKSIHRIPRIVFKNNLDAKKRNTRIQAKICLIWPSCLAALVLSYYFKYHAKKRKGYHPPKS